MRWENPPLWPVALPSICGFLLSSSSLRQHKFEALSFITTPEGQDSIITPLICAIILSFALYFSPSDLGNRTELISGSIIALLIGIIPLLIFPVWIVVVLLLWISQSMYVWKSNFPAFRIGLWIGLGGSSGIFMGAFIAHLLL